MGREEALGFIPFVQEVIDGGHLVVFIIVETFLSIVLFKAKLLQHLEDGWLHWDDVLPYDQTLVLAHRLVQLEPRVLPDIFGSVAGVWVSVQYFLN